MQYKRIMVYNYELIGLLFFALLYFIDGYEYDLNCLFYTGITNILHTVYWDAVCWMNELVWHTCNQ